MKAVWASPKGRSARRQPNPLSTKAVRRDQSFGSWTAKGFRRREAARSNAEESERNRIEGRFAGFAGEKAGSPAIDPETEVSFRALALEDISSGFWRSLLRRTLEPGRSARLRLRKKTRTGTDRGRKASAGTGSERSRSSDAPASDRTGSLTETSVSKGARSPRGDASP